MGDGPVGLFGFNHDCYRTVTDMLSLIVVRTTPQYYITPVPNAIWTPAHRFTIITIQTVSDRGSFGLIALW